MTSISALLPELLMLVWMISLFYRVNRRLDRIERELATLRPSQP